MSSPDVEGSIAVVTDGLSGGKVLDLICLAVRGY